VLDVLPSIQTALAAGQTPPRGAAWPALGYSDSGLRRLLCPDGFHRTLGRTYSVATAGSVVQLRTEFFGLSPVQKACRGAISGFTKKSRRRLFMTCSALPWAVFGQSLFITLTYPGDLSEIHLDGPTVKRHLKAFRSAWERKYGSPQAIWKLEFQDRRSGQGLRQAPHFHLTVVHQGDVQLVQQWVSQTWFRIVGSGQETHLKAGTQCVVLESYSPAAYFSGYIGKSRGSKEYQHRVPDGFEKVGRFWGLWGMRPQWETRSVSATEWVQLRRALYSLDRATCAKRGSRARRRRGRIQGEWHRWDDLSGTLLVERILGNITGHIDAAGESRRATSATWGVRCRC